MLTVPFGQLAQAIVSVVETESPVHVVEMMARVAGMWGTRLGSRIQGRIAQVCTAVERDCLIQRRGEFLWSLSSTEKCGFRSRRGTGMSGDRIAPEEYREAILAVLDAGHAFVRDQLTNEVRALFGFSRTGAILDEAIGSTSTAMLQEGVLGEASTGIRVRA